jgi:hypothetical protein
MSDKSQLAPSKASDLEIATIQQEDTGDVTLTLKNGKFEEFIFSFLGKKEALTKKIDTNFIVKKDDLLQFHYLLQQKIEKEQFISLSLTTTTFSYDDGTNRAVNTIEALEQYVEYRDVGLRSIELTWDFVFKEPKQNSVSQQKVSVFFNASDILKNDGSITIRIEHTNQVWASEVLRLFEEQISKISVKESIIYRIISFANITSIHKVLWVISTIGIIAGLIYVGMQRSEFLAPIKVEEEFIWDIVRVMTDSKMDKDSIIHFFLIKDLERKAPSIIGVLKEKGYFREEYSEVIDKMLNGYYKSGKESHRIIYEDDARLRQFQAQLNIFYASQYLKYIVLYIVVYILAALYLWMFKMKSILVLTNKDMKRLEGQRNRKSNTMQVGYGILASLIAAIIFECTLKFLIMPL